MLFKYGRVNKEFKYFNNLILDWQCFRPTPKLRNRCWPGNALEDGQRMWQKQDTIWDEILESIESINKLRK
jgi:hypothetical protein